MLIWICGPSGAGKTTIGRALYEHLKPGMPNLLFLDGDDFRAAMGNDLGYSPEDRRKNGHRIAGLCHLVESQGINVICCGATIHPEVQAFNRANLLEYYEVFVEVSFETLLRRDVKKIYRKALSGRLSDVVGVDIKLQPPSEPHLILNNDDDCTCFDKFVTAIISGMNRYPSSPAPSQQDVVISSVKQTNNSEGTRRRPC